MDRHRRHRSTPSLPLLTVPIPTDPITKDGKLIVKRLRRSQSLSSMSPAHERLASDPSQDHASKEFLDSIQPPVVIEKPSQKPLTATEEYELLFANSDSSSKPAVVTIAADTTTTTTDTTPVVVSEHTHDRGLPGGMSLMTKIAIKGTANEVYDMVEDTADTYLPEIVVDTAGGAASTTADWIGLSGGHRRRRRQQHSYLSVPFLGDKESDSSDDDDESKCCPECNREHHANDKSWFGWITSPASNLLTRRPPPRLCRKHSLTTTLSGWHWPQTAFVDASQSISVVNTALLATLVTSPLYYYARYDNYGHKISKEERQRRRQLSEKARARVENIRGGIGERLADKVAVHHGNRVVAKVAGTVIGVVLGLGYAVIDKIWY